jgi:hypothetical protein
MQAGIQTPSLRRQGTIILETWIPRIKCGAGPAFAGMTNWKKLGMDVSFKEINAYKI